MRHLRQLAVESLVYGVAGAASSVIAIITVPIYTRIFAPDDYGAISLVTTTIALAAIVVVLALDNSAHRWYWDTEDEEHRKTSIASWFWCQLATSSSVGIALLASAPYLARALGDGSDDLGTLFRIAALSLPLMTFTRVANGWLRLQRKAASAAGFAVALAVLTAGASIFFVVVMRLGIRGVFLGQLTAYAVTAAVALMLLKDWIHPRWFEAKRLREMLRFALPLVPAAISLWVVNLLDRYFINLWSTKSELGLYQVGYQLSAVVALGTSAFQQAWGPFALSLQHDEEGPATFARVLLVFLWVTSLVCAALTIFASEILSVFATPAYAGAASVVGYLSFSYMMIGLMYIAALGPSLARTTKPIAAAVTIAAVLTVLLNILLTPSLGKEGAAIATLVSWAVVPLYLFRRAQELHYIPYRFPPAAGLVALGMSIAWFGRLLPSTAWGMVGKAGLLALFLPALLAFGVIQRSTTNER